MCDLVIGDLLADQSADKSSIDDRQSSILMRRSRLSGPPAAV